MAFVFGYGGSSETNLYPSYIQKIKYDIEPIWSENTRRNSSALMTGKIKAYKWKLDVSYKPDMPQAYVRNIKDLFMSGQEWITVKFTDTNGTTQTKTMYFGSFSVEPYWFVNGQMMYQSINITLIER